MVRIIRITRHIRGRLGEKYVPVEGRHPHSIDYNIIAARPAHCKSATKERIGNFKKTLTKLIRSVPGCEVFCFDEASHALATHQTRIGAKNGRPVATSSPMGGMPTGTGCPETGFCTTKSMMD